MTALKKISPSDAKALIDRGATLIDIRGRDENARAHIPGAHLVPLPTLSSCAMPKGGDAVIFHCRSGNRTAVNAEACAAAAGRDAYMIEGGLEAWEAAGLPVKRDASRPIEIMRQVQITAGSLVVLGIILGLFVSPYWLGLSAFVGSGLIFSGATGRCGMAKLLAHLPWNRASA